jgi:hypothetical protein
MDNDQINNFLQKIGTIESNNGKNTNHPVVQFGVNKGDKAIGIYGLMPNTVDDVLSRMRNEGTITPELDSLQNLDHDQMRVVLSQRPDLQKQIAGRLAEHVLTKQGGNEDAAAFSWNAGHNLSPQRITPDKLDNSDYVQKFRGLQNLGTVNNKVPSMYNEPQDLTPVNNNQDIPNDLVAVDQQQGFDNGGIVEDPDSVIQPTWEDRVHDIMNTVKTTGQLPPDYQQAVTGMGTMGLSTEDAAGRALLFNKLQNAGYELKPKNIKGSLSPGVDVYHQGKAITSVPFDVTNEGNLYPINTYIPAEHQGQGLATGVYGKIEEATGRDIVPSLEQTEDAAMLHQKYGGGKMFGKKSQ